MSTGSRADRWKESEYRQSTESRHDRSHPTGPLDLTDQNGTEEEQADWYRRPQRIPSQVRGGRAEQRTEGLEIRCDRRQRLCPRPGERDPRENRLTSETRGTGERPHSCRQ